MGLIKTYVVSMAVLASTSQGFTFTRHSSFLPRAPLGPFLVQNPPLYRTSRYVSPQQQQPLQMLIEPSGKDALTALTTKGDKSRSNPLIAKTPPKILKIASIASIPAAAIAGFVLTPSRRILAHAVGGLATATLGGVTKSRLDDLTASAAKPAIAQLLLDKGLENVSSTEIDSIQEDYSVLEEDFRSFKASIYQLYFVAACQNPVAKTGEMKELSTLKSVLGLDNLEMGEAHASGAAELYRQIGLFTPEEELDDVDHPDRMKIDKCLFLSERAFKANDETPEAFKFEMGRVAKAFKISLEEALERAQDVAEPFYKRALSSTRAKLDTDKVNKEMLMRARESLGITDEMMRDMHLNAYAEEVKALMEKGGGESFPENAMERLNKLQNLLEISLKDADYERALEATPIFQTTVSACIQQVINSTTTNSTNATASTSDLWAEISKTQSNLALTNEQMQPLLDSIVVQTLGTPLEKAITYANVNNEKGCYQTLTDAIQMKNGLFALLEHSSDIQNLTTRYFDPLSKSSACGFLLPDDRKTLYNIYFLKSLRDSNNELSQQIQSNLYQIGSYLGLSDFDMKDASREVCGPLVEKALKSAAFEITGEDFTPVMVDNLKKRNDKLIQDLGVTEDLVKEYALNIYKDSLKVIALKCPSGIPSAGQQTKLKGLQTLLSLTPEDVSSMHVQVFGNSYKKSVLESMGATGIVLPEYRAPLEKLRDRLGIVHDEDARKLFLQAAGEKLKPMVQLLANELERTMLTKQQLSQKRGVDMGEDVFKGGASAKGTNLGIGAEGNVMSDIITIIDFYKENDIAVKTQIGTKTIEKKVPPTKKDKKGGKETTVKEQVPVYETTYPVTALGLQAIDPEMAQVLYRQFVVGGFTAQGPNASRYEAEASFFGGILGLTNEHMEQIGESIAAMVYENYIKNALTTKNSLDQQDMMFLANIQTKLKLTVDQSEKLMVDSQKKVLLEEANERFSGDGFDPTAAKAYREKCNAMGMDLIHDINLPKDRVENLFRIEAMAGIISGEITPEKAQTLTEIQESLGLEAQDCETILEAMVNNRCQAAIDKIDKELIRGRDVNCAEEIKKMLKFAAFLGGEVEGIKIEEEVAYRIVSIYEALDLSDEPDAQGKEELLRTVVGVE